MPNEPGPASASLFDEEPVDAGLRLANRQLLRDRVLKDLLVAPDASRAIEAYLRAVSEILKWPAAVFYEIDHGSPRMLAPTHQLYLDADHRDAAIATVAGRAPADHQRGLGGRVMDTGEPTWIPDVTVSPRFTAPEYAKMLGARGAVALPVYIGPRMGGVVEFFTPYVFECDPELLWTLGHITQRLADRIVELHKEHRPKH